MEKGLCVLNLGTFLAGIKPSPGKAGRTGLKDVWNLKRRKYKIIEHLAMDDNCNVSAPILCDVTKAVKKRKINATMPGTKKQGRRIG